MEAKLKLKLRKRLLELKEGGKLHNVALKTKLPRNALIDFIEGDNYLPEDKLETLYTVVDKMYGVKPVECTELDTAIIHTYGRTSLEIFKRLDKLTPEAQEKVLECINKLVPTKFPTSHKVT